MLPLDPAQQDLVNHALAQDPQPIGGSTNVNGVHEVTFDNGSVGFFKAASAEAQHLKGSDNPYGDFYKNEIGAYQVDQALGLGLVPTTAPFVGPDSLGDQGKGIGSIQAMVQPPNDRMAPTDYSAVDQQKMAVLDYVIGNGDRHGANWLTQASPNDPLAPAPAAIDNGMAFPTEIHQGVGLRSDFVNNALNKPLDPSVLDAVNNVNQGALEQKLADSGISQQGIDLAMARLNEIKSNGMITGSAFQGGSFMSGDGKQWTQDSSQPVAQWGDSPWKPMFTAQEQQQAADELAQRIRDGNVPPPGGP